MAAVTFLSFWGLPDSKPSGMSEQHRDAQIICEGSIATNSTGGQFAGIGRCYDLPKGKHLNNTPVAPLRHGKSPAKNALKLSLVKH